MSTHSREPMWYCHECNAEMRPLMVPDPTCASCHSAFVEKLENPADDPREFHNTQQNLDETLELFASLDEMLRDSTPSPSRQRDTPRRRSPSPSTRRGLRVEFGSPTNRRQFIIGDPSMVNRREGDQSGSGPYTMPGSSPPGLSEFLRANGQASDASGPRGMDIPGQLMARYLTALVGGATLGGQRWTPPTLGPAFPGFSEPSTGPANGRWGDYVFTQDGESLPLDQLLTHLMESANSTRPVPATEEIMDRLPREVLEEGSALLEKDCAVCKDQFSTKAEDEQVVVTLPCTHPFHEGCIMPWLKSSGTCPVCRHALIPQPNSHPPEPGSSSGRRHSTDRNSGPSSPQPRGGGSSTAPTGANSSSSNNSSPNRNVPSSGNNTSTLAGFFQIFSSLSGGSGRSSPSRDRQHGRRGSRGSNGNNNGNHHIPGGWGDSPD